MFSTRLFIDGVRRPYPKKVQFEHRDDNGQQPCVNETEKKARSTLIVQQVTVVVVIW